MNRDRLAYLDYAATSPLRPEVGAAMGPLWSEGFGNPSSLHTAGRAARGALEEARERMARHLGAQRGEILFLAGGTEADNLAVLGFARAPRAHRPARILRSAVEHKAVMESSRAAEAEGAEVVSIPVDSRGVLRLEALEEELRRAEGRATLVSVMWANNETGVLQPVAEIARLCRTYGGVFHSDAVQAFGKVRVRVDEVPVDLLSLSAHKIGGPKGIGVLYVREGVTLKPIVFGGGQESGLRSGTQAVPLAAGFAKAADLAVADLEGEARRLQALRDRLEAEILASVGDVHVNGAGAPRLPNILNISLAGAAIDTLLMALDLEGVAVSSGSACTTGSVEPSHVMVAMGREGEWAENTIRFSLGWGTEAWEIERVLEVFPRVVSRVRQFAAAKGA